MNDDESEINEELKNITLTTKEGWAKFVNAPKRIKPSVLSHQEINALTASERRLYAMYEWPLCPASRHDGAYVWSDTRRISSDPERRLEMLRYGVLLGNRERWDYDSAAAMNLGYDIRRDQVFSESSLSVACTANHPVREVEVG